MENLVESDPDANQEIWARYFLKSLIEAPKFYYIFSLTNHFIYIIHINLIFGHICNNLLFNYLQPVCWQAARKIL